jgi:hypothetical protein
VALKLVVFARPVAGREVEFFDWYDGTHMTDMLCLEGVESVERLDLIAEPDRPAPPGASLAIFTWSLDGPAEARAVMAQGQKDNLIPLHDSMDTSKTRSWFCESHRSI